MIKIKNIGWYLRRKKAIKRSVFRFTDIEKIKLHLSYREIDMFITENKLSKVYDDIGFVINHLKMIVYLKRAPNNKKSLLGEIVKYDEHLNEMFPKLFWEEFVCERTKYLSFVEKEKSLKYYNHIKKTLDKNYNLWGDRKSVV